MAIIENLKMIWALVIGFLLPPDVAMSFPLNKIKMTPGYKIEVYAQGIKNARSMTMSSSGVLYVGTRSEGVVYALFDANNNSVIDKSERIVIAKDLNMPNGVAIKSDDLYVAEVNRIIKFKNIDSNYKNSPAFEVVYSGFPKDTHHGWKYIAFGPDGKLYVPVGAPCNICKSEPIYAAIHSLDLKSKKLQTVARGVRNSVGFSWHPLTKKLWFTDNGRDWMGDDLPPGELNRLDSVGDHFGFPRCHGKGISDPEFGKGYKCKKTMAPAQLLGAHVAPLGMKFYRGDVLIAEHGSWNRTKKVGYRIMRVKLKGDQPISYEPFAEGWLQGEEPWGRPVDLLVLADMSILVSDDFSGAIYKISRIKSQ